MSSGPSQTAVSKPKVLSPLQIEYASFFLARLNTYGVTTSVKLSHPNRLNVAITRAIKKCFVIANYKIFDIRDEELRDHKEYESIKKCLNTFKEYYALSTKYNIKETVNEEW